MIHTHECQAKDLWLYKREPAAFHPHRMPPSNILRSVSLLIVALRGFATCADAAPNSPQVDVIISVPDQKMLVVCEGGWLRKYKVSTSRFGIGDNFGSYKTPAGRLRIWEKLGADLPAGAVLKHRAATGEILEPNAPGRDPIVSRILWLEGLETQNDNARGRGIYIHGTTEESNLGKPVSWGCIRMRSEDVIELYNLVSVGAVVTIFTEGLPHLAKWKPAPVPVLVAQLAPSTPARIAANPLPKPGRGTIERLPAVAELLRLGDERMIPADGGVANAFRGSILFSGLPAVAKSAPKSPAPVGKTPVAAEAFALIAPPSDAAEFSLRPPTFEPPVRLIDLRRIAVAADNMFDAQPGLASLKFSPPLREEREDLLLVRRANAALGHQRAH